MRVTLAPAARPRQVDGGRFAFDGRVGRQDDLVDAVADAREQALDLQVVRTDPLQRRQRAHQHVRTPLNSRLFDRADILRFFDDADDAMIAAVAATEVAGSASVMLLQIEQ
jgi:hypothetical protein